jgi:hypothetical protein
MEEGVRVLIVPNDDDVMGFVRRMREESVPQWSQ